MNATERAVSSRYSAAAEKPEAALCCPVNYDPRYLKIIPQEVIEKDYGCGDPSRHVHPGETVLDLGSGAGKICFIAAQVVGAKGRVIGVDMTDAMLEVARRNARILADRLGYANVQFHKARIQDLALDLELLDSELANRPLLGAAGFLEAEAIVDRLRSERPLIADHSIDVIVSNCVLNLVAPRAKKQLFHELFRVLKPTGRAVISDIVADRAVPASMQADPELWSGCISGALTLDGFIGAFQAAGFGDVETIERGAEPWRTVQDINFWSVTLRAKKTSPIPLLVPFDLKRIPTKCC